MSELRVALVCEGPTDAILIEAALQAILVARGFVLTVLQPEATRPAMGTGWGGVLKWCDAASARHAGPLGLDPTLGYFDLLILHLDVDVASFRYEDCGQAIAQLAQARGWPPLPCARPCPPVADTVAQLTAALQSWLGRATLGARALLCLPAQSSGTWLAAATLPPEHALRAAMECNQDVERRLSQLPKAHRIKKTEREYRQHAQQLTARWRAVTAHCPQALLFEQEILRHLPPPPNAPA